MAAAGDGSGKPYVAFLNNDTGGYITTMDDIPARAVEGLINIAAGDFDGDGMEELAVYAPNNSDEVETQVVDEEGNYPKNQLSIKIYDMDFNLDTTNWWNFHIETSLPEPTKVIEAGEGTTEWNYSGNSQTTGDKEYYCIPYLSLMAEYVDGDGIDDLTTVANFSPKKGRYWMSGAVVSLAQMEERLFKADYYLASVMDIYTGSKSVSQFMAQTLKKKVLMGYDAGVNKMFAVRNATVALGSVSDSNSREIIIAGNYSTDYDLSNPDSVSIYTPASRSLSAITEKIGIIYGTNIDVRRPKVVLGCFTYEELVGKEINSFETVKNWDWTYTESGYDRLRFKVTTTGLELEPVAMVPFAAHGTDEPDSIFLEGQVFRYNTETKEFEDTGYAPAFPTNYTSSESVWIGSAVAGNVTGSADGAETVYYTYYEENSAETANYCSVVGLWGEETVESKTYHSAVKSNSTAAFPMHVALSLPEKAATADTTTAEIAFAEGELDEDGTVTLVEGGCTPKVVVTYKEKQLRPGKDYYVTYTDNTEAGTATVTIAGMGDYTGTGTLSFEIKVPEGEEDEGEVTYQIETIASINADNRTWDSYASYYYYNQLDEAGKAFWNELDTVCKELLTTTDDASALIDEDGNAIYLTSAAHTNQLSGAKVKKIGTQFLNSNLQYYFLTNFYSMTPSANVVAGTDISYRFQIVDSFAYGEARQEATAFVEQKLAEYYEEIDACGSDEEKVKKIHDLILENVDPESGTTIYDVLTTGKAQCEGYTRLFQLLAAGAGISSIIVGDIDTYRHAWNMVNLNGSWYVVDITWDDPVDGDGSLYYTYYLVSDAEHNGMNAYADDWCSQIPEATLSSGSTMTTAGTIQAAKGTTSVPKIVVDATSGTMLVTITAKNTETIYYSMDGTTPGLTRGASTVYTEPITIEDPCVIKAVAVRDGYADNKVCVQTIEGIRFDGNGCDEGKVSSIIYGTDTQVTIPENGYVKAGYRFTGWNTTSDGTGTVYEAGKVLEAENLSGTLVLYAQWEEEEYAITYKLAGGTNNSSNPDSYKMSDAAITLADSEQKGYTFDGWYTDAEYSVESKVTTIPGGSEGAVTLYAKWTPHIYHVSFNAKGGEGTMNTMKNLEYGKTYTFPANTFTREGYTFVGWSNYSDGSSTIYEDQKEFSNLVSNDNITIRMYAIWEKEGAGENPGDTPGENPGGTPSDNPNDTQSSTTGGDSSGGTTSGNTDTTSGEKNNGLTDAPNPVEITSIKLKGISKKIAAGKKITLIPVWNPTNAANKTVTWTSSNKKYATVSAKGVVTTKKNGAGKTVTITAKTSNGQTAAYKIKLLKNSVKGVKLSAKSKSVNAGKKITIKASVKTTGKDANKVLAWSCNKTAYVTVNSKGVVTTKKAGKGKIVKITAMATDGTGKKATIMIKIK